MNPSGPRAFCTGFLTASGPASQLCRIARARPGRCQFHASPRLRSAGQGGDNGGKPAQGSTVDQNGGPDDVFEPLSTVDIAVLGRGPRSHAASSLRTRQARRRIASALPPVKIPQYFLDENVFLPGSASSRQWAPVALQEEAELPKRIRLMRPARTASGKQEHHTDLEVFLAEAYVTLEYRAMVLRTDFLRWATGTEKSEHDWNDIEPIQRWLRVDAMMIDILETQIKLMEQNTADHSKTVTLSCMRRPWWWWDVFKDFDHNTQAFRGDENSRKERMEIALDYGESLDAPLAESILDFPPSAFHVLQASVGRDLKSVPPSNFDAKTGKRPINVVAMQGYGGKAISESAANLIAEMHGADLIRLDAYVLSTLVGEYLGQNWAYSRGSLAMLGFRAAEISGRLVNDPEGPHAAQSSRSSDEDHEDDSDVVSLGGSGRSGFAAGLEDELHKIRQGAYDCFNKWELLKIDKILDQIIRSASLKATSQQSGRPRPVLIHVHDFVELNMTMEGTVLMARLRSLVDAAWQQGMRIALLGTSASEEPGDEYLAAVRELSAGELVVTPRLAAHTNMPGPLPVNQPLDHMHCSIRTNRWNLLTSDYASENLRNVNRMLRALNSDSSLPVIYPFMAPYRPALDVLRGAVLPATAIYHLATAYRGSGSDPSPASNEDVEQALLLDEEAKLQQAFSTALYKQRDHIKATDETHAADGRMHPFPAASGADMHQEGRYGKLNEYERRIAAGQVKRENLRTSFDDVHVPAETTSALKILTSLALVRPDAFSYGVLAADRIPGCLLYGPPGTGKTMLAKAVAKESGANMLEISGASINDKWVGESEKLIRAVFTMAKRLSPCVVFIDEADSILANRTLFNRASHRELINQFLKEWDGMEETNAFIMVATNRPFDLDEAVLRRLPRKLLVDLPTKDDRAAILRLLLREEILADDISLEDFALRTPLYSGSDLKNMCVAAAMAAVEEENDAAARHAGDEPYVFPDRRTIRRDHLERGLKQIPASISEDMGTLKLIRKFDEDYGKGRKGSKRRSMGFDVLDADGGEAARVRQYEP